MFKQHQEAITKKQEEMFRSHENSIMQLISGNTTPTNQTLDNLSKEETEVRFNKLNEKITTM